MTGVLVRCFTYLLVVAALAEGLRLEAVALDKTRVYSEFGYTEWAQTAILVMVVGLLAWRAVRHAPVRELAVCMALFFGILLIRENDQTFELFLPHGSWKFFAAVVFLALITYFARHRTVVLGQLRAFAQSVSFGVMLCGFVVLVFSRLFGRTHYWQEVMEDNYIRLVKNAAQEGVELLAQGLFLIAVVEFVIMRGAVPLYKAQSKPTSAD
ncbi:MAG: hypothetical protein R3233_05395 [Xanthomonadales bacterium]|nr:hypothetical protein [Xanthomonadales bacterium]